ncbi:transposase [Mycobacterium canetti]|uniref:transposase n=1 Tax=Mycobacterium canetti TaxID=78331 RepID=UPI001E2A4FAC|nr:transposase [Mycobacterium canetti]
MAIDPAAAYASAIRTPGLLPNAKLVVDHFHVTMLANDALTAVRRRVTWELHDRRGRKIDPQWANRRRLLTARERLSDKSFAKMRNRINAVDPRAQILSAWIAKEELRTLLSTARTGGDPHLARHHLHRFLPGASTRRSPNCSPWPPPLTSHPRSTPSWSPASPTCASVVGEVAEMLGDIDGQCVQVEVPVPERGPAGCGGLDGLGRAGVSATPRVCAAMMAVNVARRAPASKRMSGQRPSTAVAVALHDRGCSRGLNPPVSRRDRVM